MIRPRSTPLKSESLELFSDFIIHSEATCPWPRFTAGEAKTLQWGGFGSWFSVVVSPGYAESPRAPRVTGQNGIPMLAFRSGPNRSDERAISIQGRR